MAAFTNASGEQYTTDIEWNGYDANLKPEVVEVLNKAQSLVDFPIVLNSGYRSPERNKAAGGAKKSQHLTGNAVDISVKGLTNSQRTQLTRALAQAGANRLGVYSGNTAIHLDLAEGYGKPDGYSVYPMYDRSFSNMSRAPAWFTSGLDGGKIPPGSIPEVGSALDVIDSVFPRSLTEGITRQRMAYANAGDIPLPRPRPSPAPPSVPSAYDSPRTPTQPASGGLPAHMDITPRYFGGARGRDIIDQRPTLDWAEFRPSVTAGGLGSLLGDSMSPAAANPVKPPVPGLRLPTVPMTGIGSAVSPTRVASASGSVSMPRHPTPIAARPPAPVGALPAARPSSTTVAGRPDAPVGAFPAAPMPSIYRTGQGVAGTAELPRDYRPPTSIAPKPITTTIANPDYATWVARYGDGSQVQTAPTGGMITRNQLAAIQGSGAPIPLPRPIIPPAPPKTITVTRPAPAGGLLSVAAPIPLPRPASLSAPAPAKTASSKSSSSSSSGSVPSGYTDLGGGKIMSESGGIYYTRHL